VVYSINPSAYQHINIPPSADGKNQVVYSINPSAYQHINIPPAADGKNQVVYSINTLTHQHISTLTFRQRRTDNNHEDFTSQKPSGL